MLYRSKERESSDNGEKGLFNCLHSKQQLVRWVCGELLISKTPCLCFETDTDNGRWNREDMIRTHLGLWVGSTFVSSN